jgi:hypothetical protein
MMTRGRAVAQEQGGEEAKANKVLRLAQDEVRQDKIRRDKLLQETLEEEEELAAEEARILAKMAFLKEVRCPLVERACVARV